MARKTDRRKRYRVRPQLRREIAELYGETFANSDLVLDHHHPASDFYKPEGDSEEPSRTLFDDEVEEVEDDDETGPSASLAGLTVSLSPGEDGRDEADWPWQGLPGARVALAGERSQAMPTALTGPEPDEIVIRLGLYDLVLHPDRGRRREMSLVVHDGLGRHGRRLAEADLAERALATFERLAEHGKVDVRRCARLPRAAETVRVAGHG